MKTWTPDASEYFESWLGRVRLSVAGDPRVDADDVAADLGRTSMPSSRPATNR